MAWALGQTDIKERFSKLGMEPTPNEPDIFARFVHGELERKKKLAQDAGIKAE